MSLQGALLFVKQFHYHLFMVAVWVSFAPESYCQAIAVVLIEFVYYPLLWVIAAEFLQFCPLFELNRKWIVNF